jgi:hypothetical protein|tara:strand:+ start:569 stop:1207 length:639 start_codon:yes stop_codon:yes gene_type:complete
MSIESGLAVGCADLQAVGGIKHVLIREWNSPSGIDTVTYDHAGNWEITALKNTPSGGSAGVMNWGVYESKIESSSLTITGTNEGKDITMYECVLSMFLPKITRTKLKRLQDMQGKCLMVLVVGSNNTIGVNDTDQGLVIGASSKYVNLDDAARSQTWARISSIEGGTGAAFSDEDGVTVNISCMQYELPNPYIPAVGSGVVIGATGLVATTT